MNELVVRFENAYSTLEETVRENYGPFTRDSPVYWWEREMLFGEDRAKMKMLRELRNLFAHNPTFNGSGEVAYPTEDAISFLLEEIRRASLPDSIASRMIPYEKVLKAELDDNVWTVLRKMSVSGYSSVPIVDEDERVVGVLSEALLLDLLVKHKALCFSETLSFRDLGKDVLMHSDMEVSHMFITPSRMSMDAEALLSREWRKGRRIDILLVTRNAKSTSPLMGILTPYDLFENARST